MFACFAGDGDAVDVGRVSATGKSQKRTRGENLGAVRFISNNTSKGRSDQFKIDYFLHTFNDIIVCLFVSFLGLLVYLGC